ncbi:hypothetical protein [Shewanella vaxholmensis]|uniref:Uncharacterized protein n=1 Tax=Shewanella vaxholmensis TaxID=3063535 RepID=A0ABU9UMT9_9GAMM|nr:hypothetical protein [Shewanella sp. SP1S1-4]MDT3306365.1 hypothetical protein [Shewanella sp. SP1S1-4]
MKIKLFKNFFCFILKYYYISKSSNQILTCNNSGELAFQCTIAKKQFFYSVFLRSLLPIRYIIKNSFLASKMQELKFVNDGSILSIYSTLNQKKSIDAVSDGNKILSVTLTKGLDADYFSTLNLWKSSMALPFIYTYLFVISIFDVGFLTTKKLFSSSGDKMILALFYYVKFYCFFLKNRPGLIFVANDHSPEIRSIILAAKEFNIKTAYIQHSSVSKFFPDINVFDIAFLDGKQSLDVYNSISPLQECTPYITGAIRLVNLKEHNQMRVIENRVNIAINDTLSIDGLKELILSAKNKFPVDCVFYIRLHRQQTNRKQILNLCKIMGVLISDSSNNVFDFLSRSRYLITVSSGIVLDALRNNVLPLLYIEPDTIDFFDFVENDIAIDISCFSYCECDYSNSLKKLQLNAKYFDQLIGEDAVVVFKKIAEVNSILLSSSSEL